MQRRREASSLRAACTPGRGEADARGDERRLPASDPRPRGRALPLRLRRALRARGRARRAARRPRDAPRRRGDLVRRGAIGMRRIVLVLAIAIPLAGVISVGLALSTPGSGITSAP